MMKRTLAGKMGLLLLLAAFVTADAHAAFFQASQKDLEKRVERCHEFLRDIMDAPDTAIPRTLLEDCKGIIILRQYKAGLGIGVKGGQGVVMARDMDGQWSPPAFVGTGEASIGFMIGGQAIDAIILIMNREGLEMLLNTKFTIGGDASVAAGPLGRNVEGKLGIGTALLSYSRTKGAFVGAALEGGVMLNQPHSNEVYYHERFITPKEILFDQEVREVPKQGKMLVEYLSKISKSPAPKAE